MTWEDAQGVLERIGDNVRSLRIQKGMTQDDLSALTGRTLGRTSIVNIEAGRQKMTVLSVLAVAKALDVEVGRLFQDVDKRELVKVVVGDATFFVPEKTANALLESKAKVGGEAQ